MKFKLGFYTWADGTIINGVEYSSRVQNLRLEGFQNRILFQEIWPIQDKPASWPSDDLQKVDAAYIRYTEVLLNYVEAKYQCW